VYVVRLGALNGFVRLTYGFIQDEYEWGDNDLTEWIKKAFLTHWLKERIYRKILDPLSVNGC
jgi:hypothetical protein